MTAMRVIHTGPEHRPQVVPVFDEKGVVDVTNREGAPADAPRTKAQKLTL